MENTQDNVVRLEISERVATIILNRPHVLNALNQDVRVQLARVFRDVAADDRVRVVILQGEGRAFSAGQDQKESAAMDAEAAAKRIDAYGALYDAIRMLNKPVIAKIRGYAAGAGLQIALLADLRVAAEGTKIGMTELKVGSVAILGSALLRLLAGEAVMKRMVLLSDFIDAHEAKSYNLLHEIVPDEDLDGRVNTMATDLAGRSPVALSLTKSWWRRMSDDVFTQIHNEAHHAHAENFASGGMSAGAKKFVSKKGEK